MNIRTTSYPSRNVNVYLVFDNSVIFISTIHKIREKVIQRMISVIGRNAVKALGPSSEFMCVSFELKSGEEFCDVATLIGKALFKEFGIKRWDQEGPADFDIKRTPYVPGEYGGKKEWIRLSTFLARKHKLRF